MQTLGLAVSIAATYGCLRGLMDALRFLAWLNAKPVTDDVLDSEYGHSAKGYDD